MKYLSKLLAVIAFISVLSGCVGNNLESNLAATASDKSTSTAALSDSTKPELAATCQDSTPAAPSTCNALTATEWQYTSEGRTGIYRKIANSTNWSETTPDGRVYNFATRSSTSDSVELFDQSRDLVITLYSDRAMFRVESCTSNCPSQLLYSGRWVCPSAPICGRGPQTSTCQSNMNSPVVSGSYSNSTVTLSWPATEGASYYKVMRNKQVINAKLNSTSFSEILQTTTNTEYTVQSCNSCGSCSGDSASYYTLGAPINQCQATSCLQTGLTSPYNLAAALQNTNTGYITWSAVSGATKYELYRNNALIATINHPTVNYSDLNLSIGKHQYSIKACNEQTCSGLSAYATLTVISCTSACNNPCQTPCTPNPPVTNPCQTPCTPNPPATNPCQTPCTPNPPATNPCQTPCTPNPPATNPCQTPCTPTPPATNPCQTPCTPNPPATNPCQTPCTPTPPVTNPCQTPCTPNPPATNPCQTPCTNPCTTSCNQLTAPTPVAKASATVVTLTWDAVNNGRNYRVFRDNAFIGSTPQQVFADANVVAGHSYRYNLKVCTRGTCSALSPTISVLVPASSRVRTGIRN